MSKIYHYLASANTGLGFEDNFSSILEPDKKGFTYVLKGGPGTGKSTLLKKIGKHFEELGEEVEYFHCSSDFDSLDGVKIISCNVSVIDGTAPHAKDANLPMITDKIIDLSEFFDKKLENYEADIKALVKQKQLQYKTIYSYLSALKKIEDIDFEISKTVFNEEEFDEYYSSLVSSLNLKPQSKKSKVRNLFLDYFDNKEINSSNRFNEYNSIVEVCNDCFTNHQTLTNLSKLAISFGYDVINFYDTISNNLNAIYIKEIDTFISAKNCYENLAKNNLKILKNIKINNLIKNKLINQITNNLNIARNYHKNIEKYYVKAVDFNKINILTEKLIKEISLRLK